MVMEMLPQLMKEAKTTIGQHRQDFSGRYRRGGENSGANRITNYATNLLAGTQETLKETTGLDERAN